jgi:hypothetical protein
MNALFALNVVAISIDAERLLTASARAQRVDSRRRPRAFHASRVAARAKVAVARVDQTFVVDVLHRVLFGWALLLATLGDAISNWREGKARRWGTGPIGRTP